MGTPSGGRFDFGVLAAIAFSVFCWICLYAGFANFAQTGFELLGQPSAWHRLAGGGLVLLHAFGLLLLFVLAGGAVALMVSEVPPEHVDDRRLNGTSY
jgi:hypothetical protein